MVGRSLGVLFGAALVLALAGLTLAPPVMVPASAGPYLYKVTVVNVGTASLLVVPLDANFTPCYRLVHARQATTVVEHTEPNGTKIRLLIEMMESSGVEGPKPQSAQVVGNESGTIEVSVVILVPNGSLWWAEVPGLPPSPGGSGVVELYLAADPLNASVWRAGLLLAPQPGGAMHLYALRAGSSNVPGIIRVTQALIQLGEARLPSPWPGAAGGLGMLPLFAGWTLNDTLAAAIEYHALGAALDLIASNPSLLQPPATLPLRDRWAYAERLLQAASPLLQASYLGEPLRVKLAPWIEAAAPAPTAPARVGVRHVEVDPALLDWELIASAIGPGGCRCEAVSDAVGRAIVQRNTISLEDLAPRYLLRARLPLTAETGFEAVLPAAPQYASLVEEATGCRPSYVLVKLQPGQGPYRYRWVAIGLQPPPRRASCAASISSAAVGSLEKALGKGPGAIGAIREALREAAQACGGPSQLEWMAAQALGRLEESGYTLLAPTLQPSPPPGATTSTTPPGASTGTSTTGPATLTENQTSSPPPGRRWQVFEVLGVAATIAATAALAWLVLRRLRPGQAGRGRAPLEARRAQSTRRIRLWAPWRRRLSSPPRALNPQRLASTFRW